MSTLQTTNLKHPNSASNNIVLDASGNATLTGTTTAASFIPTSSTAPTNGVYLPAANSVAISTNGTGRLFVDASGRVGLGTSSLSQILHVYQPTVAAFSTVRIANADGVTLDISARSGSNASIVSSGVSDALYFGTANTERMRLDSSGRLGLGTSSPGYKFQINTEFGIDTIAGTGEVRLIAKDPNQTFFKFFSFFTQGTNYAERMRITAEGLVGIGTTSPVDKLHVSGGGFVVTGAYSAVTNNGGGLIGGFSGTSSTIYSLDPGVAWKALEIGSNTTTFNISGTERARIDSSGRLLVGTSSTIDSDSNRRVHIAHTGPADICIGRSDGNADVDSRLGSLRFYSYAGSTWQAGALIEAVQDAASGNNDKPTRLVFSVTRDGQSSPTEALRVSNSGTIDTFSSGNALGVSTSAAAGTGTSLIYGVYSRTGAVTGGTTSFRVYSNGNVENTNNSYGQISDIKLKENIIDANSQWDDLKAVRVRNFNFKEGQTHRQIGVIAQELEQVSPGLVYETPDRDEEGNETGEVTKGVNYSVLYMKAVKALQEAMERIEVLEQRLTDAGIA